ncbi:MAG TPA: 3-hydroxyacyl-[acyl-carrier-protein] dehydratase FabZ, partial [Phenylobacterium sp.]|nr:3-hydroxyacyl-[acyl-carrier-protein] dehydratase FabZ [Phenylobacterium sp.]
MSRKAPVGEAPSEIDITEILARIPHRIPFLLVDRCEDYVASQS